MRSTPGRDRAPARSLRDDPRLRARLGAGLAVVVSCLALSACPQVPDRPRYVGHGHDAPVRGGTLMLWEEARVRMLDPHVAFDVVSGAMLELLFESLYVYDHQMRLTPQLAAALPQVSDDGRTFTIALRKGVRFHHGRELSAEDVVWSMERMLSPELYSPGVPYYLAIDGLSAFRAKQAEHIRGLSAPDKHTVQIRLDKPDQSFVHTLAMRFAAPVPREEVARLGDDFKRRPVGTGPFRIVSWDPGVRIVLERNPHYHVPGQPYLDRILFEEGLKRDTAFLRFRNGEVDIMPRMTPADRIQLDKPAFRPFMKSVARADVFALFMNVELAPFDNVHVRRAVAFALDRERWARTRNYDLRPAGQIVPPNIPGHDPKLPHRQRFDLNKAREEMRLAGFPDGLPEPVTLWIGDSPTGRAYGELAQADLKKIGVRLRLKPVSFPVYLEETGKPKTAQMVSGGWVMDYPDASNVLSLVSSTTKAERDSSNRSFYSHPELDALLDRALVEPDEARRVEMYREANDFVAQQAPWAIFANSQAPQAWQPYVKNYRPHPTYWLPVSQVWLDLPKRKVARVARRLLGPGLAQLLPSGKF